ncbi:hypothetical protein BHM04_04900 [Macrococcus sp. IME1552]|nr:site-specific integrase [Macrococcus sp. IME1552]ATD30555.1 hypothetical protein BHM04_04900 [Macrococcus sp. IME1552]
MFVESYIDKDGKEKYRFVAKYKDPQTNKFKRVSTVMNKNGLHSQKEAERILNKKIEDKLKALTSADISNVTFHQELDRWHIEHIENEGNKATTLNNIRVFVEHIKNAIDNDILLTAINETHGKDIIKYSQALKHSRRLTARLITLFKSVLKFSKLKYKTLDISFIDLIKVPKQAKTLESVNKQKKKSTNYLEKDEVFSMINELLRLSDEATTPRKKHDYWKIAKVMECQYMLGGRIAEILAIQKHNIDFINKTVTIEGAIIKGKKNEGSFYYKDTTKTVSSYRTLSLDDRTIKVFKAVIHENNQNKLANRDYKDDGYLFTRLNGLPLSFEHINTNYQLSAKNVGIKDKDISTHIMRHSNVALLSQLGCTLETIKERVGHSDYNTLLSVYLHVTDKMKEELIDKLNAI